MGSGMGTQLSNTSRWSAIALGLAASMVATVASAGTQGEALKSIHAGELRAAKQALGVLDEELGAATTEVTAETLGLRYQTEALYHHIKGKQPPTLEALRQACLVEPESKPNAEILGTGQLADMFYALCSEVQQRPEVDLSELAIPDAPLRIDGAVPSSDFPVRQGRHLVQVQCADGTWSSQWSELAKATDWAATCADGAVAAAEAAVSDDPMDLVPFFGADDAGDEGSTTVEPEPDADGSESSDSATAPSTYTVEVQCTPKPCTVSVNGDEKGSTKLAIELSEGSHELVLVADEARTEKVVSLSAEQPITAVSWNHETDTWETTPSASE
jgi:hypothetical protein